MTLRAGLPIVLFALACSGGSPGTGPADPVTTPGDHARSLVSGGLERTYVLHAPPAISTGDPLPLVIAFHGTPSNPAQMIAISGLNATADRDGFLVAYPAASFDDWATGCVACSSASDLARVDDVAFVRALVQRIAADAPVDRSRVVAAGYSNGALFVHRLACDAADLFSGFASVAATALEPDVVPPCAPSRDRPILFFHGTEDPTFPPEGRTFASGAVQVSTLSIDATVAAAAARNDCADGFTTTDLPDLAPDGTTVQLVEQGGCAAAVVLYRIDGGGHTWPGSPSGNAGLLGRATQDVKAGDEIARRLLSISTPSSEVSR